ncbi:hypothetical protein KCU91_g8291, partial [Aureobasidium melanogenum]
MAVMDKFPAAVDLLDSGDCNSQCESWIQSVSEDGPDEPWIPVPQLVRKDIIKVEIKGTGESYTINKDVLCRQSTYFKAALNGQWLEAKTNKFLLEERIDLFRIFYYWLEKINLDFLPPNLWLDSAEDVSRAFVELCSFADRRGVPVLGDQILHKFDKHIRPEGVPVRLDVDIINLAWKQCPETSGLCRYLLAIERDANRCNLPKRSGSEYECLPGDFIAGLLKLTEDDMDWWLTATVQKQPVDMAKLHEQVKSKGFSTATVSGWGSICNAMGIKAPAGCDQGKLQAHLRALYRKWMRPWDSTLTTFGRKEAEEECPRPFVKEFFHNAVIVKRTKLKSVPDHIQHLRATNGYREE